MKESSGDIQIKIKKFNMDMIQKESIIVILGKRNTGKCMGINTEILMYNGSIKLIQDINVGDDIMGDDSTSRKVLELSSGTDILYKITNRIGDEYIVNSNHILTLKFIKNKSITDYDKKYIIEWFDCKSVSLKQKIFYYTLENKMNIYLNVIDYFNGINEERVVDVCIKDYMNLSYNIQKYLYGFQVPIEFNNKHINTFSLHKISHYNIGYYTGNKYDHHCDDDHRDLITRNYIPMYYKCNSRENRLKLLAGFLDSRFINGKKNGFINGINDDKYIFFEENNSLVNDIIYIARSLGFSTTIHKNNSTFIGCTNIFKVSLFGNFENIPFTINHEYKTLINPEHLCNPIKITKLSRGKYYGFELSGNHRYVLGNFIVTHNTFLVKDLLYHKRDIPMGTIISHTDHLTHNYDKYIPSMFIHKEYDPAITDKIFKRQEKALDNKWENPHAFLLLDDCLSDNASWNKDKRISELFFNGRHYKLFFILTMQAPMGIGPKFRTNIDFTFILKNNNRKDREKIYDNYAGVFPSKEIFEHVMNTCTEDYHCLVINNATQSNRFEDQVFIYKAESHDNFRMCDNHIWEINKTKYSNKTKSNVSNTTVINSKNGKNKIIITKKV